MTRVLVVDDDADIRATLRMALEEEHYTVAEAANGRIALEVLRSSGKPHVVLLDSLMPEMNGEEMLHIVAGDAVLSQRHRYIFFTARGAGLTPPLEAVLTSLSVPLVNKPFDINTLSEIVAASAQQLSR
jgi:CheY-like chemotaxis protein